jgi:hypothetical protein
MYLLNYHFFYQKATLLSIQPPAERKNHTNPADQRDPERWVTLRLQSYAHSHTKDIVFRSTSWASDPPFRCIVAVEGERQMAIVATFYSINETEKPATHRVYHNNNLCPPGRDIPPNERRSGTAVIGSATTAKS